MLSHAPLSKYHRHTHHHLLACVAWNSCVAEGPRYCSIIRLYFTQCWHHICVTLVTSSATYGGVSHKIPGYHDITSGYRSDLKMQAVLHNFFERLYWGIEPHTLYPIHFTQPTKLTPQCWFSSYRPGDKIFCCRNSTRSWEALGWRSWYSFWAAL